MNSIDYLTNWWASKLNYKGVNDVETNEDPIGTMMLSLIRSRLTPLTDEQIETFKSELKEGVLKEVSKWGLNSLWVSTDYNPDPILASAMRRAGIDNIDSRLPIKTDTIYYPKQVVVKDGENGRRVIVFDEDKSICVPIGKSTDEQTSSDGFGS